MTKIKFGYTNGDSFTLSGVDYMGKYVVFENSGIFTAYTDETQQYKLVEKSTFKTDVINSSLFFDRTGRDVQEMPNLINGILIQPNEYVTSQAINSSLRKLYENTTYIYSKLIAPKGFIPENVLFYSGLTNGLSSTLTWIPPTFTETYNFDTYSIERPDGQVDLVFKTSEKYGVLDTILSIESIISPDEETFTIVGCTSTNFVSLTGNYTQRSFDLAVNTVYVDDFNNDFTYNNITDTCRVGKYMYVCDGGNDLIHKYDISRLLVSQSNTNQRILIESLGGRGTGRDKTRFNFPKLLAPTTDSIYVWDSGNAFFKQYDLNFNHKTTFRRVNSFKEQVLCIGYNTFNEYFYCITTRDEEYYMYIMDSNDRHRVLSKLTLDIMWEEDKVFKKMLFSENDSNIFYIVTNKHVYKKTTNDPTKTIGRFSYDKLFLIKRPVWNYCRVRFGQANFTWNYGGDESNQMDFNSMSLNSSVKDGDMIFIAKRGRFYGCLEPNEHDRVILCENYDNYGIESVELNSFDYVQATNLNKEIYKVLRDLFVLYQNLRGRFNNDFDIVDSLAETEDAGVLRIKGYTYIEEEFSEINFNNVYIHENEPITPLSLNRCFNIIYKLQEELLNYTKPDSNKLIPTTVLNNSLLMRL
jgi:hypothetical protein